MRKLTIEDIFLSVFLVIPMGIFIVGAGCAMFAIAWDIFKSTMGGE